MSHAVPVANAAPGPVAEHAEPDPYEQNHAFLMGLENHTAKELLKRAVVDAATSRLDSTEIAGFA